MSELEPELTPELLLNAYASGIFPMGHEGEICWFCPDPRAIIELDNFNVSRSLRQRCRRGEFEIWINRGFGEVIDACGDREEGTWITPDIRAAYVELFELGFAHSVETWRDGELAGGLYGVSLGGLFAGESMFHRATDASKVALVYLVQRMREQGMTLLDVQFTTPHLERFNCIEIPRKQYLARVTKAIRIPTQFAHGVLGPLAVTI